MSFAIGNAEDVYALFTVGFPGGGHGTLRVRGVDVDLAAESTTKPSTVHNLTFSEGVLACTIGVVA